MIFLIFFGPSRLPQLGQSLGKAIRGFKQGLNEIDVDAKDISDSKTQVSHQQQSAQTTANKQKETQNS
ncbi:twin arginine translocase protein A [compost metagenome]